MSDAPLPVMFIYQGERIVAQRPMPAVPTKFPNAAFSADLFDLPAGEYTYEIVGAGDDRRFSLSVVPDVYDGTRIKLPRRG